MAQKQRQKLEDLTPEDRRKFAAEQFDELIELGFRRKTASKMMRAASPQLVMSAANYAIGSWQITKKRCQKKHNKLFLPPVTNNVVRDGLIRVFTSTIELWGEGKLDVAERVLQRAGLGIPPGPFHEQMRIVRAAIEAVGGLPFR